MVLDLRSTPATVLFLSAFLAAEGLLVLAAVFGVGLPYGPASASPGIGITRGLFCLLLAVQVLARTRQGRLWTMLYLAVLVAGSLADLAFLDPATWPDLSPAQRAQFLGAVALRSIFIVWLAGPRGREELQA